MYLVFDQACFTALGCQWADVWSDVVKRRFIFAGVVAFLILLALALTSTKGWIRRMGRNWTRLHRLVYVAAIASLVHFVWKQKSDYSEPFQWAAVLAVLLGIRLFFAVRKRVDAARRAAVATARPTPRSVGRPPSA
jgi:sulfoxide reductase heme-binding subunit YedZ